MLVTVLPRPWLPPSPGCSEVCACEGVWEVKWGIVHMYVEDVCGGCVSVRMCGCEDVWV